MNWLPQCGRTITIRNLSVTIPGMNGVVTTPPLRQPGDLRPKQYRGGQKARSFAPPPRDGFALSRMKGVGAAGIHQGVPRLSYQN